MIMKKAVTIKLFVDDVAVDEITPDNSKIFMLFLQVKLLLLKIVKWKLQNMMQIRMN